MSKNHRRYGVKFDRLMAFGIRLVVWYGKLLEGFWRWFKEVVETGRNPRIKDSFLIGLLSTRQDNL